MLALTRRIDESIIIGDKIKIVVIDIKGKQVRLGIEADANIPIYRSEIYQKIKEANKQASKTNIEDIKNADQIDDDKGNKQAPIQYKEKKD